MKWGWFILVVVTVLATILLHSFYTMYPRSGVIFFTSKALIIVFTVILYLKKDLSRSRKGLVLAILTALFLTLAPFIDKGVGIDFSDYDVNIELFMSLLSFSVLLVSIRFFVARSFLKK